ncbi:hypothetical protein FZ103_02170 [Streptomonospora sp. PA3]|uniref:hypothetical protein n=1 Tax=Streptomonospora sp. PA3 TaxID=2607326 RepID=UPI0012DDF622|nr:hypothetical protein [Streptomonospora sp. PA3]MUL39993.1 hypothetical protein [Streptomonospora sp. PA3]
MSGAGRTRPPDRPADPGAAGAAPRTRTAARIARLLPWAVGAATGALALGPALGPGFVLRYDMVAVPTPPLSAVTLGGGGGFPRAVPSDAVLGALGLLLPGDAAQALLLMAVFVLGGAGAGRLVPAGRAGAAGEAAARAAAAVFYVWNPFVAERLLLGQWAMLLGYAGLPWVAAAAARLAAAHRPAGPRDVARLVPALLPAAIGGFSGMVLSALVGLPAAVLGGRSAARALRAGGAVAAAVLLLSLPWLVPALGSGARTDPAAVGLFAARADTPFGAAGSLLSLGGIWNAHAVPAWYGLPVPAACRLTLSAAAVVGWVWLVRRGGAAGYGAGVSVAAAAGLAVALAGTTGPGQHALSALIGLWPGFGPLRDGQLYVAPLALLQAAGIGGAVLWACGAAPGARRRAGGGGHGEREAPGEPLISSQADSAPPAPHGFTRLWTTAVPTLRRRLRLPEAGGTGGPGGAERPHAAGAAATAPARRAPGACAPFAAGGRGASERAGALLGAALALAPLALLPGLLWGAAGRLEPVGYPPEWHRVQSLVDGDPRPGRVLVLPWSAYRGLDWRADGRRVVVLDPATKLFDRRTVWNDDLRVGDGGRVRVAEGEDPLARRVERLHAAQPGIRRYTRALGAMGVRYILVERRAAGGPAGTGSEAALGPLGGENRFSPGAAGPVAVHDGARLLLLEVPDRHVDPPEDGLTGLEASAWFVTVGAIIWSLGESGSSLVSRRAGPSPGAVSRKENPT